MAEAKHFLHQIKCNNGTYTKGIVVADSFDAAKQGYHAYLGAYAYGHENGTDFVSCMITDMTGGSLLQETWNAPVEPGPEPETTEG